MKALSPREVFTKKCFEAVLEVASENENVVIVHAWIYNGKNWILHAWCEINDDVIDLTETRSPILKSAYYEAMGVSQKRAIRYTRLEFFTLMAEHGHFGPFDKAFFFAESLSQDPLEKM